MPVALLWSGTTSRSLMYPAGAMLLICWASVVRGTCAVLLFSDRSHCSSSGVLFKLGGRRTSFRCWVWPNAALEFVIAALGQSLHAAKRGIVGFNAMTCEWFNEIVGYSSRFLLALVIALIIRAFMFFIISCTFNSALAYMVYRRILELDCSSVDDVHRWFPNFLDDDCVYDLVDAAIHSRGQNVNGVLAADRIYAAWDVIWMVPSGQRAASPGRSPSCARLYERILKLIIHLLSLNASLMATKLT